LAFLALGVGPSAKRPQELFLVRPFFFSAS
jgi:hypothetical protein